MISTLNELGKAREPFLFLIDFEMKKPILFLLNHIVPENCLFNIQGNFSPGYNFSYHSPSSFYFKKKPFEFNSYLNAFNIVKKNILYGNSYLVNLTQPTNISTNLGLEDIFYLSNAKYRLCIKDQFVVFSPETFITIRDGIIASHPMKGTIDASLADARATILADEKEKAEHATIVDLIRNDLSIVAKNVKVDKYRYVEELSTNQKKLLQVSSKITGQLPDAYHEKLGDIFYALLPAGSISGAPKKKTVQIITEAEGYTRGYYTGVCFYFDGHQVDSFVMIRYIEQTSQGLIFKSGGGITFMSNPEQEYQELVDKVYLAI